MLYLLWGGCISKCQVYLVPGFFGFTNIGSFNYFYRVGDALKKHLKEKHNIDAEVISCKTKPTSSIRRRALATLDEVIKNNGQEADSLHFIGHSTGGLDARLLLTPGVRLRFDKIEEKIGLKTKSLTTVSTPHFGTPLANFFTSLQGRHILQLLATMANNRAGRRTLFLSSQALSLLSKADNWLGRKNTFLDNIAKKICENITIDPEDPFWQFLEEIKNDQGAVIQLTPEAMNLFNAAVADREGVDYRCLVTAVSPPRLAYLLKKTFNPRQAFSAYLFSTLYSFAAREHSHYPYPSPASKYIDDLQKKVDFEITSKTNDGVAPSLSQIYGELIDIEVADHLDIVGQFEGVENKSYTDWLVSGAMFDEESFQKVWQKIADKIALSEQKSFTSMTNKR